MSATSSPSPSARQAELQALADKLRPELHQLQQAASAKSMKELIVGSWSLLLVDTVAADGTRMPN